MDTNENIAAAEITTAAPSETTTQAVVTAETDVRKDVENDIKKDAAGFWTHLETLGAEELAKVKAWIEAKI